MDAPHRARPAHLARHPVHATLRARRDAGSLRAAPVFPAVRAALAAATREAFRVVHFSVQADHVHLLVEARDARALARGMHGLAIRLARAVNRARTRRGRVRAGRYHTRALATPREVRNALVYVLQNVKKHQPAFRGLDPCSSGRWFDGWRRRTAVSAVVPYTAPPQTWLLRVGWRRHGLLDMDERPVRRAAPHLGCSG